MRHFHLLDKVRSTLPNIAACTDWDTAATCQNEQNDANSSKNGSCNGKCPLSGVILAAGLLVSQKAQWSDVLVDISTAEETNKLIGLCKINQLNIIVIARCTNTKHLAALSVKHNSLHTVFIPRKANGLHVFSRAQIHSWADYSIDGSVSQTGTAKGKNSNINRIIRISVVDRSNFSWKTYKSFSCGVLASYNLAKLKRLIRDFLSLKLAPVIKVVSGVIAAIRLCFPFNTCVTRDPIVGCFAFRCNCWPSCTIGICCVGLS